MHEDPEEVTLLEGHMEQITKNVGRDRRTLHGGTTYGDGTLGARSKTFNIHTPKEERRGS